MMQTLISLRKVFTLTMVAVVVFTGGVYGQVSDEEVDKIEQAMPVKPRVEPQEARRVLVFSRHEGYEHAAIAYAAKAMEIMAEKTGAFTVDHSTDMRAFRKRNLRKYDAIIFNNTTQLAFENERYRRSLMNFIRNGKGIVGIHAASDNFYSWPEAAEMMGGLFDGHPWTSGGTWAIKIVDSEHALTQSFDTGGFKISDEIYRIKEPFSRENLRVLVTLDMNDPTTKHAEGVKPTDTYIPISWVRDYDEGRLFYCSFGHNPHIYWNTPILQHYLDGIQFAMGDLDADTTPTLIKDIASLRNFDYGMGREALTNIQDFLRNHNDNKEVLFRTEQRMLDVLRADGTLAGKQFICEQLRIIGGPESVTVLNAMLSDEETSDMARYALEKIDHPSATVALRDALTESQGTVLVGIINSVGNKQDAEAVDQLSEFLSEQDQYIYAATLGALGQIGSEKALAALKNRMDTETNNRRTLAVNAYIEAADKLALAGEIGQASELYNTVYNGDYPSAARKAALNGSIQTTDKPSDIIISVLTGDDPEMQTVAIRQIGLLENLGNISEIASTLNSLETLQQVQLLAALGSRGDSAALNAVSDALNSNDEDVRIAALGALSKVGNAETAILLARHAAESAGDEQEAAREGLYTLDAPNTNQTVLSSIMQVEPEPRLELIMSIDDRRILTGAEILLETAQNPNARTRVESVRVLANVADPIYLSQMLELLADARNNTERAELENAIVAIALRKSANSNRAEEVLNLYEATQNTDTHASLIRILGNLGAEEGLVTIKDALDSNNSTMKVAAIRALSAWPNSAPAADLLRVAQNTSSNTQKILALRGYVQLLSFESETTDIVNKYQQAMELAPNVNERRTVLSGLADVKSLSALQLAADYLDNPSLKNEAEVAVVQISQDIYDEYPQETREILEQVIRSSENEAVTEEAKEVLVQVN